MWLSQNVYLSVLALIRCVKSWFEMDELRRNLIINNRKNELDQTWPTNIEHHLEEVDLKLSYSEKSILGFSVLFLINDRKVFSS